jgi:hypothetical protein
MCEVTIWIGVIDSTGLSAWFDTEDAAWAYVQARGDGYVSKHTIPACWRKGTK